MAKTLRLHTLAKELGVPSKEIIAKCHAEGIELANHMAAISAGLAESIREWFSAGPDVTSIEVASPVDLDKLPKPKPRKKVHGDGLAVGDEPHDSVESEAVGTATLTEPAPEPVAPVTAEPKPPVLAPAVPALETPTPRLAPPPEVTIIETPDIAPPPVELKPAAVATVAPALKPAAVLAPAGRPTPPVSGPPAPPAPPPGRIPMPPPPPPPQKIVPAGPQVVPRPAELKGPRVVRVEAPEPVRAPRPRAPLAEPPPPLDDSRRTGTAARGRGTGRGREGGGDDASRGTRSPRRHDNSAEIGERLREWREQDVLERKERLASATGHGLRDRRVAEKRRQGAPAPQAPSSGRRSEISITTPIILKDFCAAVGAPFTWVMKRLIEHTGAPRTINQSIDQDLAELLALDLGITLKITRALSALERLEAEVAQRPREALQPRPPVVAMLGHVDHGKTSLLDAIRKTSVAKGEAGGITQHIGAYRIDRGDWHVTFLDTPGHEAFTAMRARGANLTDVVVLVVAGDDGVMPQTIEAINHAKAAKVTIVVALNKCDLPNVDLNRIYAQLAEHELTPSEWGGTTDVIKTSAVANRGIDELVAHLSTLSELLDLKADPTVPACAMVIESQMREGQGVVAQVLVREGTLKPGQSIVCGPGAGRVRALIDDRGQRLKEAAPGTPVAVVGLDALPAAGDRLYVVDDLAHAKEIAAEVATERREATLTDLRKPRTLEELLKVGDDSEIVELNVIVKADGQASIDALRSEFAKFPTEKARLIVLHAGVGAITEADISLAQASHAIVIGFHVVADERARALAEQVGVEIRLYRVIYEILGDMQKALEGLLEPLRKEERRARVEVRQAFHVSRFGTVAGCLVVDGLVQRNHKVRLVRDGRVVLDGAGIDSLRRFKDDVREVKAGLECGIKIANFDDIKPGDVIEAYEVVEVSQKL